jgi:hypothetical protein
MSKNGNRPEMCLNSAKEEKEMNQGNYNHSELFKQALAAAYQKGNEMVDISPMDLMMELSELLKPLVQSKVVEGTEI